MITRERIAAEAAELARQFWLEIEAQFTQQIAQYQGGRKPGQLQAATQPEPALHCPDASGSDHCAVDASAD